jgi:hypothetical protein
MDAGHQRSGRGPSALHLRDRPGMHARLNNWPHCCRQLSRNIGRRLGAGRLAHPSAASHEPVSGPDQVFTGRCGGLEVTITALLWGRSVAPILGGPRPTLTRARI